jgi:hypothetical protein
MSKMNAQEQTIADEVYAAMNALSRNSARSEQAADFRAGVSDLGFCSERLRRMLDKQEPEDRDLLPAFIGTAIGEYVERAYLEANPDALVQMEVQIELVDRDGLRYLLTGHPDIIHRNLLLDVKTTRSLEYPRRLGASQQQNFQRHLYALGAFDAGLFSVDSLDDVMVGNVWVDRSADERALHVEIQPYSREVVNEAADWLAEVVWAYANDEPALKEPPREVCQAACGFFPTCRALDTDTTGLLTDPKVLTAVSMYQEGLAMEKKGGRLKNQAKPQLSGVSGSTGDYQVRWMKVGGSHVSFEREPYERLTITPLAKPRK